MGDPEVDAMSAIVSALDGLEEEARGRVLRWAAKQYGVTQPTDSRHAAGDDTDRKDTTGVPAEETTEPR